MHAKISMDDSRRSLRSTTGSRTRTLSMRPLAAAQRSSTDTTCSHGSQCPTSNGGNSTKQFRRSRKTCAVVCAGKPTTQLLALQSTGTRKVCFHSPHTVIHNILVLMSVHRSGQQRGTYVSPSDEIMSPASAKLNAVKERRFAK